MVPSTGCKIADLDFAVSGDERLNHDPRYFSGKSRRQSVFDLHGVDDVEKITSELLDPARHARIQYENLGQPLSSTGGPEPRGSQRRVAQLLELLGACD